MDSFIYSDKKLESYLRNELRIEEIAALEDELLRDDELFQRLQTVEMNLIDRYLENEMTGEKKEHLEATFLTDAENQWKLKEARIFRESLDLVRKKQSASQSVIKPPVVNASFFYTVRLPQFAAAAVILLLICVFVAWLMIRLPNQNSNNVGTIATRSSPPGTEKIGSDTVPPNRQPSPSPTISSPKTKTDPVREQWLYLREGAAGLMGPGNDLNLTISSDVETLRLRFEILDDTTKDVFRVSIKDELGYSIFPSPGTIDVRVSSIRYRGLIRKAISINIPVANLETRKRYRFEIADPYAQKTFVINKTARR